MENVIKSSAVDFEKVSSLDGTFILNRYMGDTGKQSNKFDASHTTEADLISAEAKK